jgi:hypothetical protein
LESDTAKSWFVPPIVVPAFLMVLIMARAFYSSFSSSDIFAGVADLVREDIGRAPIVGITRPR